MLKERNQSISVLPASTLRDVCCLPNIGRQRTTSLQQLAPPEVDLKSSSSHEEGEADRQEKQTTNKKTWLQFGTGRNLHEPWLQFAQCSLPSCSATD